MGSGLKPLIVKEVKELVRDPKILIGVIIMPLIIFPLMGSAINISQKSAEQAIISASFSIYTEDKSEMAKALIDFLDENLKIVHIESSNLEEALITFQDTGTKVLLYIPKDYSENIKNDLKGNLKIFSNLKSLNIGETGSTTIISRWIAIYNIKFSENWIKHLLEEAGESTTPAEIVRSPISISEASIIKGVVLEIEPSMILGLIMSQSIMLPIMVMMMLIFAIQLAATSIAIEKEQKTLETLMTLPVSRLTILSGKLVGSILVAIVGAVAYMIGFGYYMNSAFGFAPEFTSMSLGDTGLGLQPLGYLLLGVSIFVTLVSGLALALSIAVFTDNVRSAQSLVGILYIPIIVPSIILMFTDLEMLPKAVQWPLLIIPYTHSLVASKAAFLGNYLLVVRSIAYISVFTIAVLYVAARIFSTERIITARISSMSLSSLLRKR